MNNKSTAKKRRERAIYDWKDLYKSYMDNKKALSENLTVIKDIITNFSPVIERDKNIQQILTNVKKVYDELNKEIEKTKTYHSKEENNKRLFFSGKLNMDKENDTELYLSVSLIYQNLADRISNLSMTLAGNLTIEILSYLQDRDIGTDVNVNELRSKLKEYDEKQNKSEKEEDGTTTKETK